MRRVTPFIGFEPLAHQELERFIDLCQRVIEASMNAPEPPGTWCLAHSRNRAPQADVPLMAQYIQFGSDFNAFRDDSHLAAYGSHEIEGHVWEAFMTIVTHQAKNTADLYQHLAYRGFYTDDWQAAIADLCKRSWLTQSDGEYSITDTGQAVCDDVEEKTNAYFYAPWDVLSIHEFDELIGLMQRLNEACQNHINT
jgi:hypothetical protein